LLNIMSGHRECDEISVLSDLRGFHGSGFSHINHFALRHQQSLFNGSAVVDSKIQRNRGLASDETGGDRKAASAVGDGSYGAAVSRAVDIGVMALYGHFKPGLAFVKCHKGHAQMEVIRTVVDCGTDYFHTLFDFFR